MKLKISIILLLAIATSVFALNKFSYQHGKEPWTQQQLLNPADLAKTLNSPQTPQPLIFSVGPQAIIKGSIDIGQAVDKKNLNKLKQQLGKLPEDAHIVIYCGCCPFDKCPNIRPAFELLDDMQFRNHKLLNLPRNIKVDWIDHGYPVNE